MKITIGMLKNIIAVANDSGEMECCTVSIKNEQREISIICSYYPRKDPAQDIYPYWTLNMKEEEFYKTETFNGKDLKGVRDTYNAFITQGQKSFLETRPTY
jgi:hypothetical protein